MSKVDHIWLCEITLAAAHTSLYTTLAVTFNLHTNNKPLIVRSTLVSLKYFLTVVLYKSALL